MKEPKIFLLAGDEEDIEVEITPTEEVV